MRHLVQKLERTVMAEFIFIACIDYDWMSYSFHSKLCSVYVCCVKTWLRCFTDPSKGHQLLDINVVTRATANEDKNDLL